MAENDKNLLGPLMKEVTGDDIFVKKDAIVDTISDILHEYNLSTEYSFIEKMAMLRMPDSKNGSNKLDLEELPSELRDAAFLPVNTIADIAMRQDLDLVISQIPEWFTALQITRDAICESDVVDGTMARDIIFKRTNINDDEKDNIIAKIEEVEERLELHSTIKNHLVFNTLEYGEGYLYCIPYAKVFNDLYKYRLSNKNARNNDTNLDMLETSSIMNGYGYGESAVEKTLNDTIISDSTPKNKSKHGVFTEAEVMEIAPQYRTKVFNEQGNEDKKAAEARDKDIDEVLEYVSKNIT